MRRIEVRNAENIQAAAAELDAAAGGAETDAKAVEAVRAILEGVRTRGDAALAEYTERFDGATIAPDAFEVSPSAIAAAAGEVDPALMAALRRAHDNITRFHEKNLRQSWEEAAPDGTVLGQRITPIESVGLYVPGGKAFYPSTMLMNIVPARVAGVTDIVIVSPPSYNGTIHPLVLAAAHLAGATRVFQVGGAQAIAALAYGTKSIPQVLKIAGPGNMYVTIAKRLVSTTVDIDKEAGPSEVLVVSDGSGDPRFAAAELLAQAEHDEEACAMLIATSAAVADAVEGAIEAELATLSRAEIIRASLKAQGRTYIVPDLAVAADLANAIACEHLSIQTADPRAFLDAVPNAGCAVLGAGTSVAVGDYFAGPNHTLPTNRKARFSSPLNAEDFRKVTSIIAYSPEALRRDAPDIIRLATAEALTAHARAVEIRQ